MAASRNAFSSLSTRPIHFVIGKESKTYQYGGYISWMEPIKQVGVPSFVDMVKAHEVMDSSQDHACKHLVQELLVTKFGMHLRPFNPDRVLKEIQKPEEVKVVKSTDDATLYHLETLETRETPKTFENLASLRKNIEMSLRSQEVDTYTKLSIQKIADAAENAFAERAILLDENLLLFEQKTRKQSVPQ